MSVLYDKTAGAWLTIGADISESDADKLVEAGRGIPCEELASRRPHESVEQFQDCEASRAECLEQRREADLARACAAINFDVEKAGDAELIAAVSEIDAFIAEAGPPLCPRGIPHPFDLEGVTETLTPLLPYVAELESKAARARALHAVMILRTKIHAELPKRVSAN